MVNSGSSTTNNPAYAVESISLILTDDAGADSMRSTLQARVAGPLPVRALPVALRPLALSEERRRGVGHGAATGVCWQFLAPMAARETAAFPVALIDHLSDTAERRGAARPAFPPVSVGTSADRLSALEAVTLDDPGKNHRHCLPSPALFDDPLGGTEGHFTGLNLQS